MKRTTLLRTSMGIFAAGFIAAAAVAGPSPQYWNRPPSAPAVEPALARAAATANCDGCKSTPVWAATDRAPAGKGAPGARATGYAHACSGCAGTLAVENGKATADMKHGARCATMACCK